MSFMKTLGQFKIPRKETELLKTVTESDEENKKEVEEIIVNSFFEPARSESQYALTGIQLVSNKALEISYVEKRKELIGASKKVNDRYCIFRADSKEECETIAKNGFQCKKSDEIDFKFLGNTEHGVYLCKHMDILLKKEASKSTKSFYCIIVKTLLTTSSADADYVMLTKVNADSEPDFDKICRYSKETPEVGKSIDTNYSSSQVFIFDFQLSDITLRTKYPEHVRNLVPFAVLKYDLKAPAAVAGHKASLKSRAIGWFKNAISPMMPKSRTLNSLNSFNNLAVSGSAQPGAKPAVPVAKQAPPTRATVPTPAPPQAKPAPSPVPLRPANFQPRPTGLQSVRPSSSVVLPSSPGILPAYVNTHGLATTMPNQYQVINRPQRPSNSGGSVPFAQRFQPQAIVPIVRPPNLIPHMANLRPPLRMQVLRPPQAPAPFRQAPAPMASQTRPAIPTMRYQAFTAEPVNPRNQTQISVAKDPRLNRASNRYFDANPSPASANVEPDLRSAVPAFEEKMESDEAVTTRKPAAEVVVRQPTAMDSYVYHPTSLYQSAADTDRLNQTSSNIRLLLAGFRNSRTAAKSQSLARQSDACRLNTNFVPEVADTATSAEASQMVVDRMSAGEEEDEAEEDSEEEETDAEEEPEEEIDSYDLYVKFYGEISEFEEKTPRWRIIYEETGRMNTKFRGAKQLLVKLDRLKKDELKFADPQQTVVSLSAPENQAALLAKQPKPAEDRIPCSSYLHVKVYTAEQLEIIRKKEELRKKDEEVRDALLQKIMSRIEELQLASSVKDTDPLGQPADPPAEIPQLEGLPDPQTEPPQPDTEMAPTEP